MMNYLDFFTKKMSNFLLHNKINIYDIKVSEKENYDDYLTISLFKKSSYITIQECQNFHKEANALLSNEKISANIVEVMSVGVNTIVKNDYQLQLLNGLVISCKLITEIDNFKIIDGVLNKFDDNFIYISNKVRPEIKINRNSIKEIKIDK